MGAPSNNVSSLLQQGRDKNDPPEANLWKELKWSLDKILLKDEEN